MQKFKEGNTYILGTSKPHIFKSDPVYFEKKINKSIQSLTIFLPLLNLLEAFLVYMK